MATLKVADVIAGDADTGVTRAVISDNTDLHRLECSIHKHRPTRPYRVWCDHMQTLVQTNADALQIDAIEDLTVVSIPLRPTTGLWAWAQVESMHHAGMHEVILPFGEHGTGTTHLGVLAHGEGRNSIRLMLWEWLAHQYETVGPCSARSHARVAGKPFTPGWKKSDKPTVEDIVDTFMVLVHGVCAACHPYTDLSADVPEI